MEGRVEEMLRQHDIVSLRVYVHVFESSSAHPTEIVTGLNFFGEEYGCMKLDEIFGDIESETKRSDFYLEQGGIVMCEPEAHATCERSVKWGELRWTLKLRDPELEALLGGVSRTGC